MQLERSLEINAPIDRTWREAYALTAKRDVPFTTIVAFLRSVVRPR
jgi:hypothetical protein